MLDSLSNYKHKLGDIFIRQIDVFRAGLLLVPVANQTPQKTDINHKPALYLLSEVIFYPIKDSSTFLSSETFNTMAAYIELRPPDTRQCYIYLWNLDENYGVPQWICIQSTVILLYSHF